MNDFNNSTRDTAAQGSLEEKTTNHLLSRLNPQDLNRTFQCIDLPQILNQNIKDDEPSFKRTDPEILDSKFRAKDSKFQLEARKTFESDGSLGLSDILYIKLPSILNDATINISKILNDNSSIDITHIDSSNNVLLKINKNQLPLLIEYIGNNQQIFINKDISGEKFKILKHLLGHHFNINVKDFNIDEINISLSGLIKYSIPINNNIEKTKDDNSRDYIVVTSNDSKIKKYIYYGNVKESVCSIETNIDDKVIFESYQISSDRNLHIDLKKFIKKNKGK